MTDTHTVSLAHAHTHCYSITYYRRVPVVLQPAGDAICEIGACEFLWYFICWSGNRGQQGQGGLSHLRPLLVKTHTHTHTDISVCQHSHAINHKINQCPIQVKRWVEKLCQLTRVDTYLLKINPGLTLVEYCYERGML